MRRAVWLLAVGGIAAGCGPTVTFPGTGEGGATSAGTTNGPSSGQGGTTTSGETTSNVTGSSGVGGTSVASTSGSGVMVTGTSVASTGTMTSVASTGSGPNTTTTSGVGGGMPGCKTCSEAIQGAPGQFCMGSQPLFDALIQCACNVNCTMDCYNACNGNPGDQGCDLCIYTWCYNELSACQADM